MHMDRLLGNGRGVRNAYRRRYCRQKIEKFKCGGVYSYCRQKFKLVGSSAYERLLDNGRGVRNAYRRRYCRQKIDRIISPNRLEPGPLHICS